MDGVGKSYIAILEVLKQKIRYARQKAAVTINTELLALYWEIGNTISQQQKQEGWGTKVVETLAADLKVEFPDFKGLSARNLWYMKNFAETWPGFSILQPLVAELQSAENQNIKFMQPLVAQIPWAHHIILLNQTKTKEERLFYMQKTVENGWSKSVLSLQIKSHLYYRQGNAITNFELTLPKPYSDHAKETLKNPYLFDFLGVGEEMQERDLEKALIQHIKKFTLELGRGFAYVGNQYNLKVEDDDYFLDLLFYNYHLHCFVVFELKVCAFKPEFAGKLNFYINTVNEQIKGKTDKPTIGVLLCKTPNETVVKYSLQNIDAPIGVAEYEFTNSLPKQLKGEMPTIEELEQELNKETKEFNEQQADAVDIRLKSIKEKLKGIKKDEIQTAVAYPILIKLYFEGFRPLYEEIINRLSVFEDEFHSKLFGWRADHFNTKQFNTNRFEALDALWNDEEKLKQFKTIIFFHNFLGLKKAGIECYNDNQSLKLEMQDYWYGFTLINYNNEQPFLKKLYHQPLSKDDVQSIVELIMTKIMDRIEENISTT